VKSSLAGLCLLPLGLSLCAQDLTVTAVEGLAGHLYAEHVGVAPPVKRTIAPGTNLLPGLQHAIGSGVAKGALSFRVVPGTIVSVTSSVACGAITFGTPGGAILSSSADYRIGLHAQAPVRGLLWIEVVVRPSGGAPGVGTFAVDVDDDGTWDVAGNPMGVPNPTYGQLARSFGPGTLPIRIVHTGLVSVPANDIGEYSCDLVLRWIPDAGPVTSYGSPCGSWLWEERVANGDLRLWLWPAPAGTSVLLFGGAPANVPFPLPPHCPLLTMIDGHVWFEAPALTVRYVHLPPGLTIHAQAVTFDAPSPTSALLSNGLVMTVPQ